MTEEEKEVIQYFKQFIPFMWWKNPDENGRLKRDTDLANKIDIALNLIQKQQEEIEDNNKTINNLIKEQKEREKYTYSLEKLIENKDNAMNEMANYIYSVDYRSECGNSRKQIKQYFESKV